MIERQDHRSDAARQPSIGMRTASAVLGRNAKRREGKPVDLQRSREQTDGITERLLRLPDGVTMTQETIAAIPVVRFSTGGNGATILYLHGGAYALGNAKQAAVAAGICQNDGPDIISIEYRLAPEHPFPAAIDDAMAVYRQLLVTVGAENLVVTGESAGGGLLFLLLQRAREEHLPMPAGAVALFPWADLSLSGRSSTTNIGRDTLTRSELLTEAGWFAGDRSLRSPAVSPVFGSFRGFPRTYVAVGTNDLLRDDSHRCVAAMKAEGVDVVLTEYPGTIHGFTAVGFRETRHHRRQFDRFVRSCLAGTNPPNPLDDENG